VSNKQTNRPKLPYWPGAARQGPPYRKCPPTGDPAGRISPESGFRAGVATYGPSRLPAVLPHPVQNNRRLAVSGRFSAGIGYRPPPDHVGLAPCPGFDPRQEPQRGLRQPPQTAPEPRKMAQFFKVYTGAHRGHLPDYKPPAAQRHSSFLRQSPLPPVWCSPLFAIVRNPQ
jgi:hypothetical protein